MGSAELGGKDLPMSHVAAGGRHGLAQCIGKLLHRHLWPLHSCIGCCWSWTGKSLLLVPMWWSPSFSFLAGEIMFGPWTFWWYFALMMQRAATTELCYSSQHYVCASWVHQSRQLPVWQKTLAQLWHHVQSAFGNSAQSQGQTDWPDPVAGIGQGNSTGPQIWVAVSSPLFKILMQDGFVATIICTMSLYTLISSTKATNGNLKSGMSPTKHSYSQTRWNPGTYSMSQHLWGPPNTRGKVSSRWQQQYRISASLRCHLAGS